MTVKINTTWIYNLYRLGQKAASAHAKESAREDFLRYIISAFNADSGSLAQSLADDKTLMIVAGIDIPRQAIGSTIKFGSAVLGWVAENKKPLLINGKISSDSEFSKQFKNKQANKEKSSMCWPLLIDKQVVGVISINKNMDNGQFTQDDLNRGNNLMHFVALAVETARSHDQTEQLLQDQIKLNKRLEEAQNQLLQSEKMASIGQLAAGVAHEINNPVGYINSNLSTLASYINSISKMLQLYADTADPVLKQTPEHYKKIKDHKNDIDLEFIMEDLQSLIAESMEGVTRVKKIVQDLKDFSHVDESEFNWADIHGGIDSTLNIAHNEIKYKANVIKEYGDIPEVECIASQINQVFMNILVNAAHAIEDQGTITIKTGRGDDDNIWIIIRDTGSGIPEKNLKRIFDPFFTSKPVGHGTGLGLSLSYSIIEKHKGRIEVDSTLGQGTEFTIWLPIQQPS